MTRQSNPTILQELLLLREPVRELTSPGVLSGQGIPLNPGIATLSFLSARSSTWTVESVAVGYALDILGAKTGQEVADRLSSISRPHLLQRSGVRHYAATHGLSQDALSSIDAAAEVIDQAISPSALQVADEFTYCWRVCQSRCRDAPNGRECLLQCMNEII